MTGERLITQSEAAKALSVSATYLRHSDCPKVLLPGNGAHGKPLVRYRLSEVLAWAETWRVARSEPARRLKAS